MKKILLVAAVLLASVAQAQELKQGSLSNVTRLTNDAEMYENPQWSPDGSMIAFTKYGCDELFVMNANGTAKKKISTASGVGYRFQWSADSHEILVRDTRWEDDGTQVGVRRHAILAIDLNGNAMRLSRDAEYLQPGAWRYSSTGVKSIVAPEAILIQKRMKPLAATVAKEVAERPANKISFDWDSENLYLIDAVGNKKIINEGPSFCPALSPDGKKVVFNEMDDIVVMNIDGTNKKVVGQGFHACWINNSQIVYERTTDDGHDYITGELYMANIDGSNIKQLTATAKNIEMQPQVSPDGKKIAFYSYNDGQIYIADFK